MIHRVAAQIALLAFGLTIVVGLWVGNSATTVLYRALIALVGAFVLGQLVAWCAKIVLREHLQKLKMQIDSQHIDQIKVALEEAAAEADVPAAKEAGENT